MIEKCFLAGIIFFILKCSGSTLRVKFPCNKFTYELMLYKNDISLTRNVISGHKFALCLCSIHVG